MSSYQNKDTLIAARKAAFKEITAKHPDHVEVNHEPNDTVCDCVQVLTMTQSERDWLPVVRDGFNQVQIDACTWAYAQWRKKALQNPFRQRVADQSCGICAGTGIDGAVKPKFLIIEGAPRVNGWYTSLIRDPRKAAALRIKWYGFDEICRTFGIEPSEAVLFDAKAHKPDYEGLIVVQPESVCRKLTYYEV